MTSPAMAPRSAATTSAWLRVSIAVIGLPPRTLLIGTGQIGHGPLAPGWHGPGTAQSAERRGGGSGDGSRSGRPGALGLRAGAGAAHGRRGRGRGAGDPAPGRAGAA